MKRIIILILIVLSGCSERFEGIDEHAMCERKPLPVCNYSVTETEIMIKCESINDTLERWNKAWGCSE
jgi:hypothetical protein